MKKNILAVAVVAAMVAPATSMAGASFYGHAQAELGSISHEYDKTASGADKKTLEIADNARGRIGMKAVEDLGNGWKGLAVFEFKADTADGNAGESKTVGTTPEVKTSAVALTPRETMVAIKGPAGQFELGRIKPAYKYAGGVKYDAFVTTNMEARGNGGMSKEKGSAQFGTSSFHSNAVGYRGKFGPIKIGFTYGAETDDGSNTLSVMFKKGGMEAFVALADQGDFRSATNKKEYKAIKFGGKFKTGAHTVMLQLENLTVDSDTTDNVDAKKPKYTFLAYRMKMGKNTFVFQWATNDVDGAMKNVEGVTPVTAVVADRDYLALGVIHSFSKKTRIFAGYRDTSSDYNGEEAVITVGIRKVFKGG